MDIKPTRIALLISLALAGTYSHSAEQTYCNDNSGACDKALEQGVSAKSLASTDEAWMNGKLREIKAWLHQEKGTGTATEQLPSPTDLKSAIPASSQISVRDPQAEDPELMRIEALSQAGNHRGAMSAINSFLANNPDSLEGQLTKSLVLNKMGQHKEAEALLKTSIRNNPNSPELYNNLAVLYAEQGNHGKAIETLLKAFSTHPTYAQVHQNLRELYATVASQAYNRALDIKDETETPNLVMLRRAADSTPKPLNYEPAAVAMQPAQVATAPKTTVATAAVVKPAPVAKPEVIKQPAAPVKPVTTVEPAVVEVTKPVTKTPVNTVTAAPTKTQAPKPDTALEVQRIREAIAAVRSWASAWEQQNVDGYLDAYADGYRPGNGLSHQAWRAQRKQRLNKPSFIKVELSAVTARIEGDSTAVVSFNQAYRSNTYRDNTRKQITLKQSPTGWKIIKEASL